MNTDLPLVVGQGSGLVVRRRVVQAWSEACHQGAPATEIDRCVSQLLPQERSVSVAEAVHPPSDVVAPGLALRILGPRPITAGALTTWRRSASDIAGFVDRWGRRALAGLEGAEPAELGALPPRCVVERSLLVQATRQVRRQLGREDPGAANRLARDMSRA